MNRYFGVHVLDGEWHALLPRYALLANRVEGKRVLDVGCGTGIGSSLLMELGAERVDGVDYRPKVLELANMKHAKASLNFHRMLLEELSFPDDTFDLALCLDSSHPVTDKNLLDEIDRVLTDSGEYVCAIERRTVDGLERLLPQYGYEDAGESIEIPRRENQAPQIGELQSYFDKIGRVRQRPTLSYHFEREATETDTLSASSEVIDVDARFQDAGDDSPGVEILFCGPSEAPEPDTAEIQLPYYRLAERLLRLFRDLHRHQAPGKTEPEFDEIVETQQEQTQVQDRSFEQRDTQQYPAQPADDADRTERRTPDITSQLRSQLNDLSNWYEDLRSNFRQMRRETREALARQRDHIDEILEGPRSETTQDSESGTTLRDQLNEQADRLSALEDKLQQLTDRLDSDEGNGDKDDD